MGVGFDSLTMDEAVARARDLMAERRAAYVVTPNPEIVMLCREDGFLCRNARTLVIRAIVF